MRQKQIAATFTPDTMATLKIMESEEFVSFVKAHKSASTWQLTMDHVDHVHPEIAVLRKTASMPNVTVPVTAELTKIKAAFPASPL